MKSVLFFGLLALSITQASHAQNMKPLINVDHRATQSLDGPWHVIVDPYETGYYNYRYEPSPTGYFKNAKLSDPSELLEYNFDASPTLHVPGDWNTQRDDLYLYEGTVWYKKSFDWTEKPARRAFLYFGAANYEAKVWLNGEWLGEHEGGFTPFAFEISDLVRDGENFVVTKVDNKRRRDAVPTVNTDWWNYGGLTRRTMVVETPSTFIRDYFVQLAPGDRGTIRGWVQLDGDDPPAEVTVAIREAGIEASAAPDAEGRATFEFAAPGLELWSPENPRFYEVVLTAGEDRLTDEIGFRTVETRGTEILLNGEPIYLRGISIHEEAPLRTGRAAFPEDARTLLDWAQELGCNFVRLAHYPHNEYMVREADRRGILVWAEIPVYWTIQWENAETYALAERQLEEMIARDKNRAAVVLWSVANETPVIEARTAFLRRLVERARTLDPTRLVTAALERHYTDPTTLHIDDPLGAYLDVLGCNEYIGWYDGLPPKAAGLSWTSAYEKPVIISEFGGGARAGLHGSADERWTEEFQAAIYENQVEMLRRVDFVRGMSPWILMDFRSPRRPLPGIQDGWNRKGLLSEMGQRKQAFYVLQRFYREKSEE